MRWSGHVVAGLVALCSMFLVSTVWLYVANNDQQHRLELSSRSAAWLNYQAQIELVRTISMLRHCETRADCVVGRLSAQVGTMAGRLRAVLELLHRSNPPSIPQYYYELQHYYAVLAARSDAMGSSVDPRGLSAVAREIEPLTGLLQTALNVAVLQPVDNTTGDELFPLVDASLPFVLLVISGVGLMAVLARELRQRSKLLDQIRLLREAEQEWQSSTVDLLEALPVPVLVSGQDGTVRYSNYAARDLAASRHGNIDTEALLAAVRQHVGALGAGQSVTRRFPFGDGSGSLRDLSVTANCIWLFGDSVQVYVLSDTTQLRDTELRAMNAGKLAILGELSSSIAHELNQPLAVIKAAAANGRNLAMALPDGARVADKLDRIDAQVERARRIIDNVRKLGRPVQANWAPFPVMSSLGSALGLVSQQYRLSGVSLEIEVDAGEEVTVMGDPTLFEIAVLNILLNALEAFGRQRHSGVGAPSVLVRASCRRGDLCVTISDNAGGISDALLPRIFESFVSSKSSDIGTGLGLSIARRAVEGMQGEIAASNGALGAIFTIHLPAQLREAAA